MQKDPVKNWNLCFYFWVQSFTKWHFSCANRILLKIRTKVFGAQELRNNFLLPAVPPSSSCADRHYRWAIIPAWWTHHVESVKEMHFYDIIRNCGLWLGLIKSSKLPHRLIQGVLVFCRDLDHIFKPVKLQKGNYCYGVLLNSCKSVIWNCVLELKAAFAFYVVSIIWHTCMRTYSSPPDGLQAGKERPWTNYRYDGR